MDHDHAYDSKVAHWEQHLATIIEMTNKNIKQLSRSTRKLSSNHDDGQVSIQSDSNHNHSDNVVMSAYKYQTSYQNVMPPPPPQPPSYVNSMFHGGPIPNNTNCSLQQHHSNNTNTPHPLQTEGVVTRPIPKHVEDDLTKRIGQTIRKSIERTINEKMQSSQNRIDNINDKLESLSDDFIRVQRERDTLSKTLSTHDRLSRRLKTEWESQRMALNQMESLMNDEKQATKEELDILIQRHTHDIASRVTVGQFKRAVETLSSKTRTAVEKTTLSVQNECRSNVSSLRDELKVLKDSCENLGKELRDNKQQIATIFSTFNEKHVTEIVGKALHSQFEMLEANATSAVRTSLDDSFKALEEDLDRKCTHKLSEFFIVDDYSKNNALIRNIAFLVKSVLDEKEQSYMEMFASSFLSQLDNNEHIRQKIVSSLRKDQHNSNFLSTDSEVEKKKITELYSSVEVQEDTKSLLDTSELKKYWDDKFDGFSREMNQKYETIDSKINGCVTFQDDIATQITRSIDSKCKDVERNVSSYLDKNVRELSSSHEKQLSDLSSIKDETKALCEQSQSSMKLVKQLEDKTKDLEAKEEALQRGLTELVTKGKQKHFVQMTDFDDFKEKWMIDFACIQGKIKKVEASMNHYSDTINSLSSTHQSRLELLESKAASMGETVFDTLQSINSLQLELSKTKGHNGAINSATLHDEIGIRMLSQYSERLDQLEQKLSDETSKLQRDFINVQDNILEINSKSNGRFDCLAEDLKTDLLSCKNECSSIVDKVLKEKQWQSLNDHDGDFGRFCNSIREDVTNLRAMIAERCTNADKTVEAINLLSNVELKLTQEIDDVKTRFKVLGEKVEQISEAINNNPKIIAETEIKRLTEDISTVKQQLNSLTFHNSPPSMYNIENGKNQCITLEPDIPVMEIQFQKEESPNESVLSFQLRNNDNESQYHDNEKGRDGINVTNTAKSYYLVGDSISGKITYRDEDLSCGTGHGNETAANDNIKNHRLPDLSLGSDSDIEEKCCNRGNTGKNDDESSFDEGESLASLEPSDTKSSYYDSDFDSDH